MNDNEAIALMFFIPMIVAGAVYIIYLALDAFVRREALRTLQELIRHSSRLDDAQRIKIAQEINSIKE